MVKREAPKKIMGYYYGISARSAEKLLWDMQILKKNTGECHPSTSTATVRNVQTFRNHADQLDRFRVRFRIDKESSNMIEYHSGSTLATQIFVAKTSLLRNPL